MKQVNSYVGGRSQVEGLHPSHQESQMFSKFNLEIVKLFGDSSNVRRLVTLALGSLFFDHGAYETHGSWPGK
jgi:hypothetical protein